MPNPFETFNPSNPQYNKVEDLPEKKQQEEANKMNTEFDNKKAQDVEKRDVIQASLKTKKDTATFTQREYEAHANALELVKPRLGYMEGKEKLNFGYQFLTGEVLNANEDEDGIAHIVIKRGKKVIVDFQELLPNFKFVTPTYLIKKEVTEKIQKTVGGGWSSITNKFLINIGDMRDPKCLALLLHEIGHGRDYLNNKHKPWYTQERWDRYTGPFTRKYHNERQELAEEISDTERDAWAEALKIARTLKRDKNINVLEGFKNIDELQNVIYAGLLNHRVETGKKMIFSDEGLMGHVWRKIKQKLGEENDDIERRKFMKKLFDKNRLKRKPIGNLSK